MTITQKFISRLMWKMLPLAPTGIGYCGIADRAVIDVDELAVQPQPALFG
jgi:hypothetical protein